MSISLYDTSVGTYLQVLPAVIAVLDKGAEHFQAQGKSADDMVDERLYPDMLPFSFQLRSVVHHSLGCIRGLQAGEFAPPPEVPEMDYAGLRAHVAEALEELKTLDAEEIEALSGQPMFFRMGDFEIPFTMENFVLSFSLPNIYFHATTTYDMLRMQGVPLGKQDFLGPMRVGN